MCRNIRTLFNFDPPVTDEEIRAQLMSQQKAGLVELLMNHAERDSEFRHRVVLTTAQQNVQDQNDEMVLETAINGRADAIVTFNERDFRPAATRFRCSVVRPVEVVRQLEEAKG